MSPECSGTSPNGGTATVRWVDRHGSDLPLALRIIHVARDAVFQAGLRDNAYSAEILGKRAGKAFDPDVVAVVLEDPNEILEAPGARVPCGTPCWTASPGFRASLKEPR